MAVVSRDEKNEQKFYFKMKLSIIVLAVSCTVTNNSCCLL